MTTLTEIPVRTGTDAIELTESGAKAVMGLLEKRELSMEQYALRLFISGGGCSGFQYGMALEGEARDTDFKFSHHGVSVVVDEVSMDYLRGSRIDYVEDIMGSGFKIDNPNAVAACGCGSSFRTKDSGPAPESGTGCGH
jgi:iron-sulfur cluster assembly protein